MKKVIKLIVLLLVFAVILASCGNASQNEETSQSPSPTISGNMTEAEKQAAEHEKIAQEVLDNEHEHVWVFSHFEEKHPHCAIYKCECGATKINMDELADYKMIPTTPSKEHPHYMMEKCSICGVELPNENLPTPLKWVLAGYTTEHPHYGIVKCSQCEYSEVNTAITAESTGAAKLISKEATKEHPHYLIVECTYPGCDYTYVEKNATAEFEMETDSDNYEVAHPHFLIAQCSYDGCTHTERSNEIADWEWSDGVCSICGLAKDVKYSMSGDSVVVEGTVETGYAGRLAIPSMIEFKPVEIIGAEAFLENTLITSVVIPDTVRIIGRSAFENCTELQLEPMEICPYCNIAPGLREEPECPVCGMYGTDPYSGHPVGKIGLNVEIIEESAFRNCVSIHNLHFNERIIEIMDFAFAGCSNLEHISFSSMIAPNIQLNTFEGIMPGCKLIVPAGAVGYEGPGWEGFEIIYYE